jgi:large subunit ribosomal protein L13
MKTVFFNKENIPKRKWLIIDANKMVLGRLSSKVAYILQGKHNHYYTPNCDTGDFIIIINADKVCVTGKKSFNKTYWRHTGYPGGIKKIKFLDLQSKFPKRIIYYAIKKMLPKNRLGKKMLYKLKVYASNEHPHLAQKPKTINI